MTVDNSMPGVAVTYSEGADIEDRILRLLKQAPSLTSNTRIAAGYWESWPVRYHLSPERSLLLRPFDFSGLDVLELGAGMGAVSRYLAETCRHLTAVEGTLPRTAALRERLRDLTNWEAHTGNIQAFDTDRRYDVVTLIGVLEYAELFIGGDNPHATLLQKAASFLKPGGVLVTAIENRLGLKYWNGAEEDHTNTLFDGITGYPGQPTPRTFSRQELLRLIRDCGTEAITEYFPFPDYKMPHAVLSADLLARAPATAAALASATQPGGHDGIVSLTADGLLTASVASAGLLPEFANSFLMLSCDGEGSPVLHRLCRRSDAGELAWHYNIAARAIPTLTIFSSGGGIEVEKTFLQPPATTTLSAGNITIIWHPLPRTTLASGEKLLQLLWRSAYHDEWQDFIRLLENFIDWSLRRWAGSARGRLQQQALDAIASNAMYEDDGAYNLFDLEWTLQGEMPASWFILRNVLTLRRIEVRPDTPCPYGSFRELYLTLCHRFGIAPDLRADLRREISFQAAAGGASATWSQLHSLLRELHRPFRRCLMPRHAAGLAALQDRHALLESELAAWKSKHNAALNSATYLRGLEVTRLMARFPQVHRVARWAYRVTHRSAAAPGHPPG